MFAGIAITLAASGIYSVLVYSVERRSHEIGIRLALGAKRADVMGLILGRGLRLSLAGAAAGTIGALGLTRFLKSLLYGVTPHDPVTLAAGCVLVVLVALSAAAGDEAGCDCDLAGGIGGFDVKSSIIVGAFLLVES